MPDLPMGNEKSLRTCNKGHQYYKSSDCPVCPVCESKEKLADVLFSSLSAPALRALKNEGIITLEILAEYSEKEILELHGMGKASIPKLNELLKSAGLKFKTEEQYCR